MPTDSLGLVFPALDGHCRALAFAAAGQVYLQHLETGRFELASVDANGRAGWRPSGLPVLDTDARRLAFDSAARILPGRRSRNDQVYVRDLAASETQCVSVSSDGELANDANLALDTGLALSADGRVVAYSSHATNLVARDPNRSIDVFVHELASGTTERVSVRSDGREAHGDSAYPSLDAEGRLVAFSSDAGNLVADDSNGLPDVFLHDRRYGSTVRISVGPVGQEADGASDLPALSADGRHLVFASDASNLLAEDRNGARDVFLYDRERRVVERVSAAAGPSDFPRVSGDGSRVAFVQREGDGAPQQVVVVDRVAARRWLASASGAAPGDDDSGGWGIALSGDGRCVAFTSFASNLSQAPASLFVAELPP